MNVTEFEEKLTYFLQHSTLFWVHIFDIGIKFFIGENMCC